MVRLHFPQQDKSFCEEMVINQIEKKTVIDYETIIKFQILTYCFLNNIRISEADLNCLLELVKAGETDLTSFCNDIYNKKIFKSTQTVRNMLTRVEKEKLILKSGKSKKKIKINPELNIYSGKNFLLTYKLLSIEK